MPQMSILTDELASAIWRGDTASILDLETSTTKQDVTDDQIVTDDQNLVTEDQDDTNVSSDDAITNIWAGIDDTSTEDTNDTTDDNDNDEPVKKGRKASDLISVVNQLIKDEIIEPYAESDEVKTIEDAKDLIKLNLKQKEETGFKNLWKEKVESYSPQVQAILHYADKGGKDVTPLLSALSEVENTSSLDIEDEKGQEEIVRQVLKLRGTDEDEINDTIETLKDLDKLKDRAKKYQPELERQKSERINLLIKEQEDRENSAREASRIYIETITNTLNKDVVGEVKLKKEDKYKIMGALAEAKHRSIGGYSVNEFVKTLEDLQFGKNANYDHFLNIVHYAIDKKGFLEKIKESLKTELTVSTVKELRSAKQTAPNTDESVNALKQQNTNTTKGIKRNTFVNPFK